MNIAAESVEMPQRGIRKVLNRYTPQRVIVVYIVNDYDSQDKEIRVNTIVLT